VLQRFRDLRNWLNSVTYGKRFYNDKRQGVRGLYVLERAAGTGWHLHFLLKDALAQLDPGRVIDKWAHICARDFPGDPSGREARIRAANRPEDVVKHFDATGGAAGYVATKIVQKETWYDHFGPAA